VVTAAGARTVLVADLDDELLVPLRALEKVLLSLAVWEDNDREDPPQDRAPVALPAPLADGVALVGVQRLAAALGPPSPAGSSWAGCSAPTGATSTRR
jgi:hypothetical protein